MISCTEFIWAYNELFKFLEGRYGKQAVVDLWVALSEEFLTNLDELVAEKGTRGMEEYWTHTLTEEGADYSMSSTEDSFSIEMHQCPSVGLLQQGPAVRYRDYCEHCAWLYPRILERYGFAARMEIVDAEKGVCRLTVLGPRAVVVTLGSGGALLADDQGAHRVPAFPVDVVDTTAAGDAFVAGLACALLGGAPLLEAVRFANAAGALAVTKAGAQPSLPHASEVEALLASAGESG